MMIPETLSGGCCLQLSGPVHAGPESEDGLEVPSQQGWGGHCIFLLAPPPPAWQQQADPGWSEPGKV